MPQLDPATVQVKVKPKENTDQVTILAPPHHLVNIVNIVNIGVHMTW